jgi:predicted SprT family Zn-dependent metalloprotease
MDQKHRPAVQQVQVAERVTFPDGHRTVAGHVARKGRTFAHVVTDDGTEVRVPYRLLSRLPGAPRKHVQSRTDTLRAHWHAGDRVRFVIGTETLSGTISRVNPRYAHVVCDDDREYRVPYARLTLQVPSVDAAPHVHQRTQEALEAIAARARAWITTHRLTGWSFQFDHAATRAGCCHYRTQVISLAHAYARSATDAEIDDALLHEIAHALVGQAHGHDHVWQAQAVALGCSGRRCHDVQFTPPRYIVTCARACWVATAERRQRGAICRTCQSPVHYTTYTEERWQQAQGTGSSKEGSFASTRGASDSLDHGVGHPSS